MFSLILALSTIVLLAALSVVAINYTPWWIGPAQIASEVASEGFVKLERAYELAAAANTPIDTPPTPMATGDGGLQSRLQLYYGFLPKAPNAMGWGYGHQAAGGPFQGMDYLCLQGASVNRAEYEGLRRLARTLGSGQSILGGNCGDSASGSLVTNFPAPVAFTYYMQFVPGTLP